MRALKNSVLLATLAMIGSIFAGCDSGPDSPRGFSLPVGDAESGKELLLSYYCLDCHTISGIEDPFSFQDLEVLIPLGGKVSRTKTYADLVTSIINPSHRLSSGFEERLIANGGVSKMTNFNDLMTVSELTDLVTFLQPYYELVEYTPSHYSSYY